MAGGHEPGQRVEGGIKIKKGKLRGVESDGMMCSIEELGSNREMYPEAPEYGSISSTMMQLWERVRSKNLDWTMLL